MSDPQTWAVLVAAVAQQIRDALPAGVPVHPRIRWPKAPKQAEVAARFCDGDGVLNTWLLTRSRRTQQRRGNYLHTHQWLQARHYRAFDDSDTDGEASEPLFRAELDLVADDLSRRYAGGGTVQVQGPAVIERVDLVRWVGGRTCHLGVVTVEYLSVWVPSGATAGP